VTFFDGSRIVSSGTTDKRKTGKVPTPHDKSNNLPEEPMVSADPLFNEQLRQLYSEVLEEPLPHELKILVKKLKSKEI